MKLTPPDPFGYAFDAVDQALDALEPASRIGGLPGPVAVRVQALCAALATLRDDL